MAGRDVLGMAMLAGTLCVGGCGNEASAPIASAVAPTPAITVVPVCEAGQLLGYQPDPDELTRHRKFPAPVLRYPAGTQVTNGRWGFPLTLKIGVDGRVICLGDSDEPGRSVALDAGLRKGLDVASWRYTPFLREGEAVVAVVTEQIREEELAPDHRPLPVLPIDQVSITLARSACYGTCPDYQVTVHGDGRVEYVGRHHVDVVGKHTHRIPVEDVARLVDSARAKDLWSLRESYSGSITDHATYKLILVMGEERRVIEDYVGAMAGMPLEVSEFEDEVDQVARSAMWTELTVAGVEALRAEGFDFASTEGGELLLRALANRKGSDDAAILALLAAGAPLDAQGDPAADSPPLLSPVLEQALLNGRAGAVVALLKRGLLETGGKPDRRKLDAAFHAAIRGGSLAAAQAVWNHPSGGAKPALVFQDEAGDEKKVRKLSPVSLLLDDHRIHDGPWDGLAIAQWLKTLGVDLKAAAANGETLLHIAAGADDADFVRFMLAEGIPASTPGEYDLPAMGSVNDEDVAMILLEAGTDTTVLDDEDSTFRDYAIERHWGRVVAWLDAAASRDAPAPAAAKS